MFHLHYKLCNLVQHTYLYVGFLGRVTSFMGTDLRHYIFVIHFIWSFFPCAWKTSTNIVWIHSVSWLKTKTKWGKNALTVQYFLCKYLIFLSVLTPYCESYHRLRMRISLLMVISYEKGCSDSISISWTGLWEMLI